MPKWVPAWPLAQRCRRRELAKWIKKLGAEAEPTEVIATRLQKEPPDGDALLMLAERYGKSG